MASLQELVLYGCSKLERLPPGICKNNVLRLLNLRLCTALAWDPADTCHIEKVIPPDADDGDEALA